MENFEARYTSSFVRGLFRVPERRRGIRLGVVACTNDIYYVTKSHARWRKQRGIARGSKGPHSKYGRALKHLGEMYDTVASVRIFPFGVSVGEGWVGEGTGSCAEKKFVKIG